MTDPTPTTAPADRALTPEGFSELATAIEREVGTFIVGQAQLVRQTLISLLAGSHALLEGVPGLGKTMLVRTMAEALDLGFSRIQFTPDLMPADIIGANIVTEDAATGRRQFEFQ
ncbi:MAG: AAA family ATPase, partial [Candidatus Limnocylindria bacterium]